jgi:2-polyprenyl-6-methoxyphenol hydroxylase-like FAD-dependent oxidoreductase
MELRRAAVLGGGPGGLYAARLLKLAQPGCEVVVYEQGEPGSTFGFGVGLAAGTQRNLEGADPDTLRDIVAAGYRHDMTLEAGGRTVRVHNDRLIGIARTELLAVLQRHAEKAGVRLEYGTRQRAEDLDADLVVAADGISSSARDRASQDFGTGIETGRGLYLWCGTDFALDAAVFAPVETEHGPFVTHAYPYSPGLSTFLIETDEATWRRAGFDVSTSQTAGDDSDEFSLRYLERAFAGPLRGHRLIGNRTRWTRFRTVRCQQWWSGRTVLLGDAAHTAHFSIGSGTKLAMEDAIGLVEALEAEPDAPAAFARYQAARRPAVERMQELARRSQLWWESFPARLQLPAEQLMVAYMTRAGNVALDRFAATNPGVVAAALGQFASSGASDSDDAFGVDGVDGVREVGALYGAPDDITSWVLSQPLEHDGQKFPSRVLGLGATAGLVTISDEVTDPLGPAADAVVERARAARAAGSPGFWFTGPSDRPAVLTRLDLAERVRTEVGGLIVMEGPFGLRDDLAAGLVSGRADLICYCGEGT